MKLGKLITELEFLGYKHGFDTEVQIMTEDEVNGGPVQFQHKVTEICFGSGKVIIIGNECMHLYPNIVKAPRKTGDIPLPSFIAKRTRDCPLCGSDDVMQGHAAKNPDQYELQFRCAECNAYWTEGQDKKT